MVDKSVRWVDICRAARMLDVTNDIKISKTDAFNIRKLLEKNIAVGRVVQVARGRYQLVYDVEEASHEKE